MTKRRAFDFDAARRSAGQMSGRRFWMSVDELIDDCRFRDLLAAEFPTAADIISDPQRRQVLKLMGASLLLAGLGACSDSRSDDALPYVNQPEHALPGVPRYYATSVTLDGYAQPVVATTYDGRPTKLDGNPDHPATRGRSDSFMQAAVLALYDPERAKLPTQNGAPVTWGEVEKALLDLRSRWQQSQGEGLRVVLSRTTSPTLLRQIRGIQTSFPQARLHIADPLGAGRRDQAMRAVFGRPVEALVDVGQCDVIVSLDDDFLGPGPWQVSNALRWATKRGEVAPGAGRGRLHVAESLPGAAGVVASSRLAASPRKMGALLRALSGEATGLDTREQAWVARVRADLEAYRGRGVLLAGMHLAPDIQMAAAWLNEKYGNAGRAVRYVEPIHAQFDAAGDLPSLAQDIASGAVQSLVILDANIAYAAPAALDLARLIKTVPHRVCASGYADETTALCEWHLPLTHELESWGDARAVDGTEAIIQPVVRPFYRGRNIHQVVDMLGGTVDPTADAAVRAAWQERFGGDDARWRSALRDGFVKGTEAVPVGVTARAQPLSAERAKPDELEIVFQPDPCAWDGRFASVAWQQELPKPLTKITWDNVVSISPAHAARGRLANGDRVEVTADGRVVEGPVFVMPGQADNTIGLFLGYGRRAGEIADGIGYDAYAVLPADGSQVAVGTLRRRDGHDALATTQPHHRMDGFDFVREVTARNPQTPKPKPTPSLYSEPPLPQSENAWGMVIDLDLCIGCNACISACNVENNVAVVGKEQVAMGREMLWLRVDRYYVGEPDDPRTFFQPVPCMHCEKAPCEMGCPVHATVHSPEGVNQMVYNRCIGTRTCSSYCPYKVRRFNWYDYRKFGEVERAAKNPDVTVRSRGVMEKCTYCTQRIQAAHVAADKEKRPIRDGDVVTACQQACPTRAIVFGDIKDEKSEVSKRRKSGRHYVLLEELGTRPRTTYLARWNDDEGGAA